MTVTTTSHSSPYPTHDTRSIIMDIGDVLVTMSLTTSTTIPSEAIRTILTSPTWGRYECGKLTESECYRLVAEEHNLDLDEFTRAFNQDVRSSMTLNRPLFAFLRQLKSEMGSSLRLFIMSNVSQPDITILLANYPEEWSIFDKIFPSSTIQMRKPSLGFYRRVFDIIGGNPKDIVFVDDKVEHVLAARSLGACGVVYDRLNEFRRRVRCLVCDPIKRSIEYLCTNAIGIDSANIYAYNSMDRISRMLALNTLQELFINSKNVDLAVSSFSGLKLPFDGNTAPPSLDVDLVALQLLAPGYAQDLVHTAMDTILQLRDVDGIIRTFVDSQCGKTDPVVCANVLALFYSQGRGSDLKETENWLLDILRHRSYLDGTRYYPIAESFLYSLSCLLQFCPENESLHQALKLLLEVRLKEQIRLPGDVGALTMRILACTNVGIDPMMELQQLRLMQLEDGSWPETEPCRKIDSSAEDIKGRCVVTALALKAMAVAVKD
ncbi:HAD-like domain-containing protein [Irpex rosettiformis]|uniref:HAD-like domain-containing protein n=1 Tax=Irpex rosettiformis TaxID=378272 RepID=A0ACB8U6P3_9APHY|nr:HAD-like domain-containing protein [Irpex rosettiformis]